MRRILRGGVAVLLGAAASMVVAVAPAHARTISCDDTATWSTSRTREPGCTWKVQGGSTANNAKVVQDNWAQGAQKQAWLLWKDANGYCVLRSATTSSWKAVSMTEGGTANGVKAIQYTYIPNSNEEWILDEVNGGNEWTFENRNSGRYLEIPRSSSTPGVQADQYGYVANALNEEWTLVPWP